MHCLFLNDKDQIQKKEENSPEEKNNEQKIDNTKVCMAFLKNFDGLEIFEPGRKDIEDYCENRNFRACPRFITVTGANSTSTANPATK